MGSSPMPEVHDLHRWEHDGGVAQWLVLRRRGVLASRWLAFWIVGVVVGVGVAVAAVIGLEMATRDLVAGTPRGVVAQAVPWSAMLLTLGLAPGCRGGAMSARALNSALAAATADRPVHLTAPPAAGAESRAVGKREP
jgi:hypothetical protein